MNSRIPLITVGVFVCFVLSRWGRIAQGWDSLVPKLQQLLLPMWHFLRE